MKINTVTGSVDVADLGTTFIHEHIICSSPEFMQAFHPRWNDPARVIPDAVEKLKYPAYLEESIHRIRGYFYRDGFGKQEEAVKCFEKALAVPNISAVQKAVLWNNIGMAYEKDEEYEKAVEAYKKVGTFGASGWFIKSAANSVVRLQKKIDAGE